MGFIEFQYPYNKLSNLMDNLLIPYSVLVLRSVKEYLTGITEDHKDASEVSVSGPKLHVNVAHTH